MNRSPRKRAGRIRTLALNDEIAHVSTRNGSEIAAKAAIILCPSYKIPNRFPVITNRVAGKPPLMLQEFAKLPNVPFPGKRQFGIFGTDKNERHAAKRLNGFGPVARRHLDRDSAASAEFADHFAPNRIQRRNQIIQNLIRYMFVKRPFVPVRP